MAQSGNTNSGARVTGVSLQLDSFEDVKNCLEPLGDACSDLNDVDVISKLLGGMEVEQVAKFYDRHPQVDGWYYRCYADVSDKDGQMRVTNGSLCEVLGIKHMIRSLVIVKDGPADGTWETQGVDIEALARTLWWYKMSGNDVKQVAGEREYARFLKNLKD